MRELEVPRGPKGINFGGEVPTNFKERDLPNEPLDVLIQNRQVGLPLALSFGGHGEHHETGEAFYGWSKAIYEFPEYSHATVRDSYAAWYFNGIRGASTSIESTVEYLDDLIDSFNPSFVLCCGTSMGAYAAILFGVLLNVDHVLALAPQTLLEDGVRSQADGNISKVYQALEVRPHEDGYRDLTNLVNDRTAVEIVYSEEDEVDRFHALRLEDMKNVTYTLSAGTHGEVAKYWRDNGSLSEKLRSYIR